MSGRESGEVSVARLHAETAHHPECHGEEPDVVALGDGSPVCGGMDDLDSTAIVISRPSVCQEFSRVTLKIPSSNLDSKDSCLHRRASRGSAHVWGRDSGEGRDEVAGHHAVPRCRPGT